MLYATVFHSLAGMVTGSVFKARTLLLLLGIVLVESIVLAISDIRAAGLWALVNLSAVQFSYIAGVFARAVFDQGGFARPPVKIRRP